MNLTYIAQACTGPIVAKATVVTANVIEVDALDVGFQNRQVSHSVFQIQ